MSLQSEIDVKSKEIHTDGYPMSIGELITLYRDGEMDIHPEFQRFFRWSQLQKSKLIESILLGIPIPSIFVSQREDGVWDVIDGLQRLSTILEFVGELKDVEGKKIEASTLTGTEYLPSLEGKLWESDNVKKTFSLGQKLLLKRAKLDVKIIKSQSDKDAKYELFQRLNTGGSILSYQEIRNCLLVMVNPDFYKWLVKLADYDSFVKCMALSERQIEEQYNLELALRFFVYKNSTLDEVSSIKDISEFITKKMLEFSKDKSFSYSKEQVVFEKTFDLLAEIAGDDAFTKYESDRERFVGAFSISAYEVIASGLSKNIKLYYGPRNTKKTDIALEKIKSIWDKPIFKERSGSGMPAARRLPLLIPLGEEVFSNV
ncbi:DUF262 domain-containing protein [Hymenobacter sp. UYCo722]|uniref:DUF262 domain-containing protein n=1 Tax=Hymenobacter sp. UYCo722 TaxID=3156335 RepID=UPI003397D504